MNSSQELVRMIHSYCRYWEGCEPIVAGAIRDLQAGKRYQDAVAAMESLNSMRDQLRNIATKALQLEDFPKATKALELLQNVCSMMDSLDRGEGECTN